MPGLGNQHKGGTVGDRNSVCVASSTDRQPDVEFQNGPIMVSGEIEWSVDG